MSEAKPRYITVYESISGWKAVMLWWNPEMGGFYEPWKTKGYFKSKKDAVWEAKWWADEEGLEYKDGSY